MSVGHIHPSICSIVAEERRVDLVRSVERQRALRDAGVPSSIESVRFSVGRLVVRIGETIAGRKSWSRSAEAMPVPPAASVLPSTLKLAR